MNKMNLKIAGLLAVAVAVIGITVLISRGGLPEGGVSADLGDLAAGNVVVMSQTDYQAVLNKLEGYFVAIDKITQDNIVSDVVKILEQAQK